MPKFRRSYCKGCLTEATIWVAMHVRSPLYSKLSTLFLRLSEEEFTMDLHGDGRSTTAIPLDKRYTWSKIRLSIKLWVLNHVQENIGRFNPTELYKRMYQQ